MAGCFRAVEVDLLVGAVAEGFVGRLAAAAERILRLWRIFLSFPVLERFALGIGDNPLLAERQVPAYEIRAVFGDLNLRALFLIGGFFCTVSLGSIPDCESFANVLRVFQFIDHGDGTGI